MTLKTFFSFFFYFFLSTSFFFLFFLFFFDANEPFESRAIEQAGSLFSIEPPLPFFSQLLFFFFIIPESGIVTRDTATYKTLLLHSRPPRLNARGGALIGKR